MNGTATANRAVEYRNYIARLLTLLCCTSITGAAATLSPAALDAWKQYVDHANQQMDQRLAPGRPFLWLEEAPDRLNKVRAGEILIAPFCQQGSRKVPNGLIHHWMGAVFIPGTQLQDVLKVVRDYPHYPDLYQPSVVASKAISHTESKDRFSTMLVNQSLLLHSAFESNFESDYVRLDDRRVYSRTWSTRIQEIDDYGSPDQHALPEGTGSGTMWRLYSITRYAEADGGVYIEVEALGLTRDVPAALHWLVDPIIRRLSRSALTLSLQQTEKASQSATQKAQSHGRPANSLSARGSAVSGH
jgi:hypothetical protein